MESKPVSWSSLSHLVSSPTDGRPNPFQLDSSQKAVDSNGKLEAVSTSGIFSFVAPSNTASGGLFATSPAFSATSALGLGNFTNGVSTSSSNIVAPLTSISSTIVATTGSSTASVSSLFGSTAASIVSKEAPTKFGLSAIPPEEVSAPATTPSIFNFGVNSTCSSTSAVNTSAAPGIFNVGGSSSTSPANAGNTSSSATPGTFSFGASSASLTNTGSIVNPSPFNFGATSASPQASNTAGIFGSSRQPPKSTGFTPSFSSSNPSGFTFGASSSSFATPSMSPVVFGSTARGSSGSTFSFGSTSSTNSPSQPMFGNSAFAASPGKNDNMECSMAEDLVQAPAPTPAPAPAPAVSFGQPSVSPSPGGFAFGSASSPFLFGSQQSQSAPQNSSPFAASSSLGQAAPQSSTFATSNSLEFGGGGSFSLGSSGPDKSGRRIVKVNRNKHKRK